MQSQQIQSSFGISLSPINRILIDCSDSHSIGLTKNASRSLLRLFSCVRRLHHHHHFAVFPLNVESQGSNNMLVDLDFDLHSISSLQYEQSENEGIKFPFDSDDSTSCNADDLRETERRRKIGLANKGNVPWNKGRPHTPETRARIKQRTIEAMRDPKIRKKMSESPRRHSDEVKTKISSSLRQLWGERLKCKRAKEKLFMSWSENIAEVARKGGVDEEELSWDSYEKLKREIALQNLEYAKEKAKAKERKKIQAEIKAQTKAKSESKPTPLKRPRKKQDKPKVVKELNLKTRLTKIQRKKSVKRRTSRQVPTMVSCYPSLERLDLQFIEMEKLRNKVSLEDEIRAAKNKRNGSLTTSFGFEN
ncbi:hypothetical protein V2J09_007318 [Rumex salicifolius]